jgi:hypothetical protein
MLLFVIYLLINKFKRDSKGINNSNKFNYLNKYLNLGVITRFKALNKLKN